MGFVRENSRGGPADALRRRDTYRLEQGKIDVVQDKFMQTRAAADLVLLPFCLHTDCCAASIF